MLLLFLFPYVSVRLLPFTHTFITFSLPTRLEDKIKRSTTILDDLLLVFDLLQFFLFRRREADMLGYCPVISIDSPALLGTPLS